MERADSRYRWILILAWPRDHTPPGRTASANTDPHLGGLDTSAIMRARVGGLRRRATTPESVVGVGRALIEVVDVGERIDGDAGDTAEVGDDPLEVPVVDRERHDLVARLR